MLSTPMAAGPTRILILSAPIGEGHDLPARALATGLLEREPGAQIEIADTLAIVGDPTRRVVMGNSHYDSTWGNRVFDVVHRIFSQTAIVQRRAALLLYALGGRRVERAIAAARPDVVVATYPIASELLGALRRRRRLAVPAVSAITDLAALRYWAHPSLDLHLITHPESAAEVLAIAPGSELAAVRGLTGPEFYAPRDPGEARAALGLPADGPIVVVSGGGWAVGDLAGAAETALAEPGVAVVCLCGRNADARDALTRRFAHDDRVTVLGFTDRISDLFAAADVLVHSTAGLTVLEALMRGCRVISYGWGVAHVRLNNLGYVRHGLAEVALTRDELRAALRRSLAAPGKPDASFAALPDAAELVLDLARAPVPA